MWNMKLTTDYWDIKPLVTISFILETTKWIHTIKLALESTYQTISDDISYIIWRSVFIEIQVYQYSDIISYLLK